MTNYAQSTIHAGGETIKAIYDQGRAAMPEIELPDNKLGIVIPKDYKIEQFSAVEPELTRIHQSVTVYDEPSFIAYVNRFKDADTQIFAVPGFINNGQASIVASIDYHMPGEPTRNSHFCTYAPRYSEPWKRWHAVCKDPLKQVPFAELIEECRADIQEPAAALLLNIVRTFKANKKTDFDSVVYQTNGSVTLNYSESVQQQGQSGALPEVMQLGIPVYFRGQAFKIPVMVRYRVGNGGVTFDLKLDRADIIEDAAFGEILARIEKECEVKPYLGSVR